MRAFLLERLFSLLCDWKLIKQIEQANEQQGKVLHTYTYWTLSSLSSSYTQTHHVS